MFMVSRGGVMGRVVVVVDGIPEPELEPELGEEDGGSGRGKSGRIWSAGIEYGIFLFRTSGRVWVFVDRVGLYLECRVYPGNNNDTRYTKQPWNKTETNQIPSTSIPTPSNDLNSPVVYYENDKTPHWTCSRRREQRKG